MDWENLLEEIEGIGRSLRIAMLRQMEKVMGLYKWENFQRAWKLSAYAFGGLAKASTKPSVSGISPQRQASLTRGLSTRMPLSLPADYGIQALGLAYCPSPLSFFLFFLLLSLKACLSFSINSWISLSNCLWSSIALILRASIG